MTDHRRRRPVPPANFAYGRSTGVAPARSMALKRNLKVPCGCARNAISGPNRYTFPLPRLYAFDGAGQVLLPPRPAAAQRFRRGEPGNRVCALESGVRRQAKSGVVVVEDIELPRHAVSDRQGVIDAGLEDRPRHVKLRGGEPLGVAVRAQLGECAGDRQPKRGAEACRTADGQQRSAVFDKAAKRRRGSREGNVADLVFEFNRHASLPTSTSATATASAGRIRPATTAAAISAALAAGKTAAGEDQYIELALEVAGIQSGRVDALIGRREGLFEQPADLARILRPAIAVPQAHAHGAQLESRAGRPGRGRLEAQAYFRGQLVEQRGG